MNDRHLVTLLAICAGLAALTACSRGTISEAFGDPPAWDRYAESLEEAGLSETALGREWVDAGVRALRAPPAVETPYREEGYFAPERPSAVAGRLSLRRGQRLVVEASVRSTDPARVFLDLFRMPPESDSLAVPEHVAGSEEDSTRLDFEVPRDGDYVLRLQPELLRGGRYELTARSDPLLAFPVEGAGNVDVRSGWGDPRDAGRRSHEGVDIFAPRGTPALAVEAGRVRRVGGNRLGGNIVWLSGDDGRSYYYAHLDRQAVRSGEEVLPGDTIGWVGNTGNAAPTPPHLHFGVRVRGGPGWVDPYPYIARTRGVPPEVTADTSRLGDWLRTEGAVNLRSGPGTDARVMATLSPRSVLRAVAGTRDWYRVELPDRTTGFLWAPLARSLDAPVGRLVVPDSARAWPVRDAPSTRAAVFDSAVAEAEVPVLGRFEDWAFVRAGEREGWMYEGGAGR